MQKIAKIICIDGPSGVGKGTISKILSEKLGYNYLDSGKLYRALAYVLATNNLTIGNNVSDEIIEMILNLPIEFKKGKLYYIDENLNAKDITDILYSDLISKLSSQLAQYKKIREALTKKQRGFLKPPGLIADGRDMGTVIFPDSDLKFFLVADPEIRAKRRYNQLKNDGYKVQFNEVFKNLMERDRVDISRANAPLEPALDAKVIDSTNLTIDEVLEKIYKEL